MKIMDILVKDAVILDLGVRNKRDVLAEMAHALAKVEPQIDANRLLEVLLEREALQSTGIGEGVAIPTVCWRPSPAARRASISSRSTDSRRITSSCSSCRSIPEAST
jgi:hypothetical protein